MSESKLFICTTQQVGAQFEAKENGTPLPQTDEEALTWIPDIAHALYHIYRQRMSIEEALTKTLEFYTGKEQAQ